ncbi:MAG: protein kinase [Planctomycetes bacterium]|nr:protein kinase [Planctomycetota bacterium]
MADDKPPAQSETSTSARLDPLVGKRLASYEVLQRVARGGMGVVYRARHVYIDKIVALKVLDPALASRTDLIERFRTEAQSLARVEHENVIKVIDILEDGGVHFIVMDFAEGVNLRNLVKKQGPLKADELLSVARQTAEALYSAHREGILHRDIKPENLILNSRGRCKLADFGLAGDLRMITEGHEGPLNFGTPAYSAPEVLKRMVPDKRSDIFSYGATLYFLACGEPPFGQAGSQEILLRQKQGVELLDARRVDLHPRLLRLISDCLQYEAGKRPESFADILQLLPRRGGSGQGGTATTPTGSTSPTDTREPAGPRESRPHLSPRLALAAVVLAAAATGTVLLVGLLQGEAPATNVAANLPPANTQSPRDNRAVVTPPPGNVPQPPDKPAFLPEDEAFNAAELDARLAASRGEYAKAWDCWTAFAQSYPNSRRADEARGRQNALQRRVSELRTQEYEKCRDAVDLALKEKRMVDAEAALGRFPAELLAPLWPDEEVDAVLLLDTLRQRVEAAESGDLARVLEQAEELREAFREDQENAASRPESERLRVAGNLLRERELLEAFLPGRTSGTQAKVNKRLAALRKLLEKHNQDALLAPGEWRRYCGPVRGAWALAAAQETTVAADLALRRDFEGARKALDARLSWLAEERRKLAAGAPAAIARQLADTHEVENQLRAWREDVTAAEKAVIAVEAALRKYRTGNQSGEFRVHESVDANGRRSEKILRYDGRVVSVTAREFDVQTSSARVTLRLDMLAAVTVRNLLKNNQAADDQLALVAWLVAVGCVEDAQAEEARIQRMPNLPADASRRVAELADSGRLGSAALRRLVYMAAAAGTVSVPDFAALHGAETLEAGLLGAQARVAAGDAAAAQTYLDIVRVLEEAELVHLDTYSRALAMATPQLADLRVRAALEPLDAEAHAALAAALLQAGRRDEAMACAGRALLLNPANESAWRVRRQP